MQLYAYKGLKNTLLFKTVMPVA